MQTVLDAILGRLIKIGRLTVRWPDGSSQSYAGGQGPEAALAIRTRRAVRHLVVNPALKLGECYMDGTLVPERCGIYEVLDVLSANLAAKTNTHPVAKVRGMLGVLKRRIDQYNPVRAAQRNVAHHYDLNGRLYSLFLDRDRQYSCAYFRRGDETLEEAQTAKKRHIAAKLLLNRPDLSVLDIGCGWGQLILTAAREYGVRATGVTLSEEQFEAVKERIKSEHLEGLVDVGLTDYREVRDRVFDRVVSVGMIEHVGKDCLPEYFAKVKELLRPGGISLLHCITGNGKGGTNSWINAYIFPGGYIPGVNELVSLIIEDGFQLIDIEELRRHYGRTLEHWARNFENSLAEIEKSKDETFIRMWRLYLNSCAASFNTGNISIHQILFSKGINDEIPWTRAYMYAG